jgi:hypothetical protein
MERNVAYEPVVALFILLCGTARCVRLVGPTCMVRMDDGAHMLEEGVYHHYSNPKHPRRLH